MAIKNIKTCLVITYGPVPTRQYQKVEGGGMRAWGLAVGLKNNGISVTVGVNNSFPQEIKEYEGIRLVNWGQNENFINLINSYDAVLMSYTMGSDSLFVADNINDSVQLILDAYVPIYVEVSARESEDIDTEYRNYMSDIVRFNKVLRRGDYFLCASDTQKIFYTGVLSSLGIINPRSYKEDRIIIAPFGIHNIPAKSTYNPYLKLGLKNEDFITLWFGGLYPWFRVEELLNAVLELSSNPNFKFVIVGGKNPFNPNPDFAKQYEFALEFSKNNKILNKSIFFVDWVDFDDRINWYKHADLVVSLNQPGQENGFSWRTRVMDFVWGELAILTNGGDPLSETLINSGAAIRLTSLSHKQLEEEILELQKDSSKLIETRKAVIKLKYKYYWDNIMQPIASLINQGFTPFKDELNYKKILHVNTENKLSTEVVEQGSGRVTSAAQLPLKIIAYAKRKGVRRTAKLALNIAKTQSKIHLSSKSNKRRYIFISHPIDNTGAPTVLLQIIEEFANKYGKEQVQLVVPGITSDSQNRKLREMGIKIDKAAFGLGFRLIRLQLGLRKNDFVLMNTAAVYDNYRDFILLWLRTGRLRHAYWFIHEDKAQLPYIHKEFLDEKNINQVHKLISKKKLTLLTPSMRTKDEYEELLNANSIFPINLLVKVDDKYKKLRSSDEYERIDFYLSGTPSDGRKGQLLALSAFYCFMQEYYAKNPKQYRDFGLHLVAIGTDYISQQIKWIGDSILKDHLKIYPSVSHDKALNISAKCNAVICCSLNETFGLYVAEGMFMGHVVLRNNSAGISEQLKDGVNGFFIDHTDINQFASVIEKLLNKSSVTNKDLQKMGKASQDMIANFSKNNYLEQLENIGL